MRTFKEYLVEFAETHSVKSLVFGDISRIYTHIPLSLPMWKRITEIKDMYGVHSTTVEGVEKLVGIQNSSAQISTVDWASDYGIESLVSGIATEGGAVVLVKGLAVFEADEDVYSYQDKQGRRWVDIMNLKDAFPTIGNEIDLIKHKIFNKLEPELDKLWKKEYGIPLTQGQFADLERFGKTANKGIRMYFDDIEKFLKKTSTQGKMKNAVRMQDAENSGTTDWNENIITKFKVETVIFNKRKLAINYSMEGDVLNKLLPNYLVTTSRPSVDIILEKIRKKVGSVILVPDEDYKKRVKELVSTAKIMNKR